MIPYFLSHYLNTCTTFINYFVSMSYSNKINLLLGLHSFHFFKPSANQSIILSSQEINVSRLLSSYPVIVRNLDYPLLIFLFHWHDFKTLHVSVMLILLLSIVIYTFSFFPSPSKNNNGIIMNERFECKKLS